ncbi:hypothetical protein H6P81_003658 [Aristolochia fimbriata]|uniref:Heat shock factor binding protein 1 n=1 Tax=Aristolochia fimbriata TaxID=158543 RepID=A0AAV7FD88_ARIFI|nr:hypothetical protein H6P81_003658 [Aristolochia fimbriata]
MNAQGQEPKQSPSDTTAFVQNLLQQMLFNALVTEMITTIAFTDHFSPHGILCIYVSLNAINSLDEMGCRIDELEQSVNDLKAEMGEGSSSPVSAPKNESDEPSDESA